MSETETLEQSGENAAESRARRLGWVPKEDFKGDPDKHRSAEEFLERGESLLPLLKRDNDRLHESMSRLEKKLAEQEKTFGQFAEFATKAEERAYNRAKTELEAKRDAAIATADIDGARQAQGQIDALNKEVTPKVETKTDSQADPSIQAWISENEWFNKSPSLRAYSVEIFGDLEKQFPGKSKSELLAETKQKTMDRFPDKFGINPKRDDAGAVSTPGGVAQPRRKAGRSYDDLPAEAKKACDKFVRTIPKYTREDYCKNYEWD
jgi:hypothetical protein